MKILNNGIYLLLIDEKTIINSGDIYLDKNNNIQTCLTRRDNILIGPNTTVIAVSEKGYDAFSTQYLEEEFSKLNNCFKIIAYYPLIKEAKKLDLPLLPNPFEEEIDIEKLSNKLYPVSPQKRRVWIEGYKAAQSSNKQFSLEDIRGFSKWLDEEEIPYKDGSFIKYFDGKDNRVSIEWLFNKYLQSLSTQQLPKEFVLGEGDTIEEQIKNGYYVY
jgi:hypothetical protein